KAWSQTPAPTASSQSAQSEQEHIVRALGGNTRFSPAVRSIEALRKMAVTNRNDLSQVLDLAGLSNISTQVLDALAAGPITETKIAPGERLEWMALRRRGKADILKNIKWGGKAPFEAFTFKVTTPTQVYTFVVPKDCGNLSLAGVEAVPPPP